MKLSGTQVGVEMKMKFNISSFIITILICVLSVRTADAVDLKFSLPTFIQPIKYKLELLIDVQHKWPNYEERVCITVKCVEMETDAIFLNVKRSDLIINEKNVRVKLSESNPEIIIGVRDHVYDIENDIHIIRLLTFLEVDKVYDILIPFEKAGSHRAKGYFVDEHKDASKNGQEFIATQLGPSDARGIFPCLDQIDMKAQFKVFLKHSENFWAFSNMKKIDTKRVSDIPNFVEDEFDESLPISTSNIAFVLINSKMFELLDSSVDGPIQVYAAETNVKNMHFAYRACLRAMNFYSEFFESQYALSNLNVIALPNFDDKDRAKYGIITVPDSRISFPDNSGVDIAWYICHSMSHQWLGTLVTVSSWNIYWLHEAFVYLLERPCLEYIIPEQKFSVFDSQLVKTVTLLLEHEVGPTSHTMLDFDYFDEIDKFGLEYAVFDKGFCLVRMLKFFFGDKLFKKCMASYMKTPNSSSSNLEYMGDVFTKIVNESQTFSYHIDVNNLMKNWISKKGFPLLTVTRVNRGKAVKIKQKNFRLFYDPDETLISDNVCWMMPLRIATNKDVTPDDNKIHHWIECAKPFSIDINADNNDWMILDLRLNIICRINYDVENWNLIRSVLMNSEEYDKINIFSRIQLISDMFTFSDTGILSYEWVLDTMEFLVYENSLLPMTVALTELLKIRARLLGSENVFPLFQAYVRKILEVKFDVQAAGENDDGSQMIREKYEFERLIIKSSCIFDVQTCRELGKNVFNQWYFNGEENEEVEDDREAYYCQAMKSATTSMTEWKFLWSKYDVKKEPKFNNDILNALGCSSNETLLKFYLGWSINEVDHQILSEDGPSNINKVDLQISPEDSPKVFESLAMNEKGYSLMKNFISQYFKRINIFLSGSNVSVDLYLKKLLDITTKTDDLNDLRKLIEKNYVNDNNFVTNVKKAERNIWWLKEYKEKLTLYFQTHSLPHEFEQKM